MSSTSTCFQAPVHNVAHIYSHRETESQQPYSNNQFSSYSADSRSPSEADSFAHPDLYDQAGYNQVPSTLGPSQFENPEEALRYAHMQDENMNNHASPQLLCPRPTLPSSQFSSQYSWYDWPSEAPANIYQSCSEQSTSQLERYSSSTSHLPQVPEIQHSFESQQFMPKFYPAVQEFAEMVPSTLTSNHLGDADYMQQPFSMPMLPFDRGPTHHSANFQSRYYAAHQPVLPEQRSSYSELALNLTFMNGHNQPPLARQELTKTQDSSIPKRKSDTIGRGKTPSLDPKKNPFALGLNGPPLTAIGRKVPLPAPLSIPMNPTNPSPSGCGSVPVKNTTSPTTAPTAPTPPPKVSSKTGKTRSSRSVNEPRRPSLACTFCRERKIACGRPPNGSPDPTCNQCARRSFRCQYLVLKSTSRTSSRSPSSSLKRK